MLARLNLPALVLVCSSTFWGISWLPLKFFSAHGIDGLSLIFVAHAILAIVLLPIALRRSGLRQGMGTLVAIAFAGGMGIFCFTYALIYGDVIRVMVLFYLLPIWGVIGGRIFLREHVDPLRWLGVVVAISGAFLTLGASKIFTAPPTWVDLLALLSGISFAANNILFRGVQHFSLDVKLLAMFIGCACITGTLMLAGVQAFPTSVAAPIWGWFLLYTFVCILTANIASQWAVERMDAGRSSIIIIVQLLVAVLSTLFIGDKHMLPLEWLGCTLVAAAALAEATRGATSKQ